MRRSAIAVLAALFVVVLAWPAAPAAKAATAGPKVVIVVGATESTTASYRSYGDEAATEARKYTSNVVKVYSPNATWTAVKNALQGASIVLYLGHGNGYPSPYRTSPWPYSQNGFGLNAAAGQGDSNVKYYGEYYVGNEVRLAPHAVVLLSHLCYAAGNSEPGNPEPSVSVAHQRIDNYGAGFLKAGAAAVIAETHFSPADWIRVLFTTRQTVEQAWRTYPRANGHVVSWASSRTAGATSFSDPDTATTGFYRSMVGSRTVTTADVTGGAFADTGTDPSDFVVPGAASVDSGGTGLYPDPSLGWHAAPAPSPTASPDTAPAASPEPTPSPSPVQDAPPVTLGADTKLRVVAEAPPLLDGTRVLKVATLDGTKSGYVTAAALTPRDSYGPWLRSSTISPYFSPNGDGIDDRFSMTGDLSETLTWTVRIRNGSGKVVAQATGTSAKAAISWDGRDGAANAPDGSYTWQVTGADGWGNPPLDASGSFTMDRAVVTGPRLTFVPVAPVRLLDTRTGVGLSGAFSHAVPRTFQIAGRGGIPATAVAVTVNVTVVGQSRAGYVALTPTPNANPSTSTINFPVGDIRANGATVSLGPDGTLSAVYRGSGTTQLVLDVTGYYAQ